MKKVLGILAVSAALVGFSACGGGDGGDPEKAAGELIAELESAATDLGATLDLDCVSTNLDGLTEPEIKSLTKAVVEETSPTNEKLQAVNVGLLDCLLTGDEATEETSEEMTEETTP